jgi:FkbM family methyltransferase
MLAFDFEGHRVELQTQSSTDYIHRHISEYKTFLHINTLRYLRSLGYRGTAVDVGANIGNQAIFFSRFCAFGRVVAVEGSEEIQKILRDNLRHRPNGACPVEVIDAFVSSVPELYLNRYHATQEGRWFLSEVPVGADSVRVSTVALDEVCVGRGRIDLIRIDVEGHELEVLKSGIGTLLRDHPHLCVEVFPGHSDHLWSFLGDYGYLQVETGTSTTVHFVHVGWLAVMALRILMSAPRWMSSRSVWRWRHLAAKLSIKSRRWRTRSNL